MSRRAHGPDGPPAPDLAAALEISYRFLAARPRSRWETERRLRRAGVDDAIITAALERLTELGLIDDAAFATWWAEQRDRHAPRGLRLVQAELRQRGVGAETIEALRERSAVDDRPSDDPVAPSTEEQRAREALERRLRGRPVPDDARALQRLAMFLVRRGFDPETARKVLSPTAPYGER